MTRPRPHPLAHAVAAALLLSCGGAAPSTAPSTPTAPAAPTTPTPPAPTRIDTSWDVSMLGVPPVIQAHYIDLARIAAISRFRSGIGHDYSDDVERCRSMKHYFRPAGTDWASVRIVSPVTGRVTRIIEEWAGTQIQIRPSAWPAFGVVLFHVATARPIAVGDSLTAGEPIGTHVGTQTTSDVAVWVTLPGQKRALVSYVDALPDSLRAPLVARGAPRDSLVLTRAQRDAAPLACDGETFVGQDPLPGWVALR
ncbi:hypothetical protein J421_1450 [Gemmatirosa kalamazoonensis]|uniref:Peptidase M23 n=1 Tax=Gemmatirosa kalamazoonensis TaxID=861299 RepID=W0REW6_9BACT|nr:hypothetical protein [Gemmatirosa kalamazoonensis]AHG88987.1 hypothetical protein J421_1450 [Gemmatirosa kalamazoonensis]